MNSKQRAFADNYIICGNATEAAKKAGYSEKTAYSNGSRLLKNAEVSAYVQSRIDQIEAGRVADMHEILCFYTAVMRGEVKDCFGLDPQLSDRLKAADALMKRIIVAGYGNAKTEDDPITKALREEAARLEAYLDDTFDQ